MWGRFGLVLVVAISAASLSFAQDTPEFRAEPILHDFVPDPERLELVTGDELAAKYPGKTIAGIYDVTRHDDQRYVETLRKDGRISYRERNFKSEGEWFVRANNLCFVYDEQPGREHCFYEFRYGDCVIAYSNNMPLVSGRPAIVGAWASIQKFVESDFKWPDVPASEADEFTCFLAMV